ncbi:hypothetical protein A2U01_0060805, partial [Trifolium medium]|nr:hypothetical protein [Trifolium medium]
MWLMPCVSGFRRSLCIYLAYFTSVLTVLGGGLRVKTCLP